MVTTESARRAAEAQRLIDEPMLREALERLEREAIDEILRLPFWADRKRRILTDKVRVIRGFREHLRSAVIGGAEHSRKRLSVA